MSKYVNPVKNDLARAIFDHALSSVDPRPAVRNAIKLERLNATRIYAIAIGKAAASMAVGLEEALGEKLSAGVVTAPTQLASKRWQTFIGGHPLPNEASLEAARAAFALLDRANAEQATVIFLISGGGSAMIEWPVSDEISLPDLREANKALIACGAHIAEINSVRRVFSAVKGGKLARRAPRAQVLTLIVSDTNRGDEASVASGPTLPTPADAPDAMKVVEQYHLEGVLPESIMKAVRQAKEATSTISGAHHILLDNWTAIEAARNKAFELGFDCVTRPDICEQPIEEGCDLLLSTVLARPVEKPFCIISGGEFSCPVRGDGRGGRNLETVLRCAMRLDNATQHVVVLSAGTDGIDGNSPAAGAFADETTIQRARNLGLDPDDFLARSDSYNFFAQLNDLIVTGPTGTNVRDLRIFLRK
jgi:glycerate 2-kinase